MNRLGFRNALVIVLSLLLLLSLSITIAVFNHILLKTKTEDLERTILNAATYESYRIAYHVEKSANTVTGLAALYEKYSKRMAPEDLMTISAVAGAVHKVTAGFEDGRSYASKHDENFPRGVGDLNKYDPRGRPWFKEGRASDGLTLSKVFFTARDNIPMLGAIHPVDQGTLLVDVRLNHLEALLEKMIVVDGAVGFIANEDGLILASTSDLAPPQENIGSLDLLRPLFSTIYAEDHTFNSIQPEGKEKVLVSKRIDLVDNNQWYLVIIVDKETTFASVNEAIFKMNTLTMIITVISVFAFLLVLGRLYGPVLQLKNTVQRLADGQGDLTSRLEVKSDDDLGSIAKGINKFIEDLQVMMIDVKSMSAKLSSGVDVLRGQQQASKEILSNHTTETSLVVNAMDELRASAKLVSDNASNTVNYTKDANAVADSSRGIIVGAQESLHTLVREIGTATDNVGVMSNETQDIASILTVIVGIAEQTNLLALNAAIEAARAGEQGRGFAVVADEVRALAGKTQQSTGEVESALNALKGGASSVVTAIERTGATSEDAVSKSQDVLKNLEDLTDFVGKINSLSDEISKSSNNQNGVIQEINTNILHIHNMVDDLNSKGQSMFAETENIAEINQQLAGMVSKFKLQ